MDCSEIRRVQDRGTDVEDAEEVVETVALRDLLFTTAIAGFPIGHITVKNINIIKTKMLSEN